jgi:hypothetical protein
VTVLASDPVGMSGASAPAAGGTLMLAEPYGGWTATLNGRALKPVAAPVDGWAQGFALPSGGGQLSLTRNNLARMASLIAELLALLAVCVLALPGKRADPAEEADALAALREARDTKPGDTKPGDTKPGDTKPGDTKRGVRGPLRPARAASAVAAADGPASGDSEVVAAGIAGRRARIRRPGAAIAGLGAPRLAMPRRRGRRQEDGGRYDFGADELPETVAVAEWPAGETQDGPGVAGLAGSGSTGDGSEDQAPGDEAENGSADRGADGNGRGGGGGLQAERAPWDMAGDWSSTGGRPDPDPWGDDPWADRERQNAAGRRDSAVQRGAEEQRAAAQWGQPGRADQTERWGEPERRSLTGPHAAVSRTSGQQPAMPREAPAQLGDPWDIGPKGSAPWRTGPQTPLSATGSEPAATPWDAGNQSAPSAWNRDTGEWEVATRPAEPAQPAGPAYPAEPGRSAEPAYFAERSYPAAADYPAQRETGSGPWPTSTEPATPAPAKPERHSHRASKHGKPSRWRGSGDRSGSGGES